MKKFILLLLISLSLSFVFNYSMDKKSRKRPSISSEKKAEKKVRKKIETVSIKLKRPEIKECFGSFEEIEESIIKSFLLKNTYSKYKKEKNSKNKKEKNCIKFEIPININIPTTKYENPLSEKTVTRIFHRHNLICKYMLGALEDIDFFLNH
ncbi:hypothetical protein GF385_02825 [Candidatus Dependentiae bacterium]|nr:hypothetical protein [Candidatus Dependentiae bacterium]